MTPTPFEEMGDYPVHLEVPSDLLIEERMHRVLGEEDDADPHGHEQADAEPIEDVLDPPIRLHADAPPRPGEHHQHGRQFDAPIQRERCVDGERRSQEHHEHVEDVEPDGRREDLACDGGVGRAEERDPAERQRQQHQRDPELGRRVERVDGEILRGSHAEDQCAEEQEQERHLDREEPVADAPEEERAGDRQRCQPTGEEKRQHASRATLRDRDPERDRHQDPHGEDPAATIQRHATSVDESPPARQPTSTFIDPQSVPVEGSLAAAQLHHHGLRDPDRQGDDGQCRRPRSARREDGTARDEEILDPVDPTLPIHDAGTRG